MRSEPAAGRAPTAERAAGAGHCAYRRREGILRGLIYVSALTTVALLALIIVYILANGIPHISWAFLSRPYVGEEGILPMLINTLYLVVLTLLIATPIGLATAVYLTQYAKQGRFLRMIRYTTEVLAGIPSIIFGLVGSIVFNRLLGLGFSLLSGALTMTLMILPILVRTSEEAIRAVPGLYAEGALALGASRLRVIRTIILPTAMPGILTAVILSMGRVIGESAALIFTLGVVPRMPNSFFGHILSSARTLTLHLYTLFSQGISEDQAFATATVLLVLVLLLNFAARIVGRSMNRGKTKCGF